MNSLNPEIVSLFFPCGRLYKYHTPITVFSLQAASTQHTTYSTRIFWVSFEVSAHLSMPWHFCCIAKAQRYTGDSIMARGCL